MADKEERILCSCYNGIQAELMANNNIGMTKKEAIEVMAKAICAKDFAEDFKEGCGKCACRNEEECNLIVEDSKYIKLAEAALNALLEGGK